MHVSLPHDVLQLPGVSKNKARIHRRPEYYEPQSPPELDNDLPPDTDESDSEWLEHLSQQHRSLSGLDEESEEELGEPEEGLDLDVEGVDPEGAVLEADELEEVDSEEEEVDVGEFGVDRCEEWDSESDSEEDLEEELIELLSWIVTFNML